MKVFKWMMLAVMLAVILFPQNKVLAATAINENDFIYKDKEGKQYNFIEEPWYTGKTELRYIYDNDTITKRKIKIGDKSSRVLKKYGNTKKKKVKTSDKIYKSIQNDTMCCEYDISLWKTYLEYTYKKSSNKYTLRFYLNSQNKVCTIMYIRNVNKYKKDSRKILKSGITFRAPKGKKITTKKMNGNKVYILPKGTKVILDDSKSNTKDSTLSYKLCRYNTKGIYNGFGLGDLSYSETYLLNDMISSCTTTDGKYKSLKPNKLGKYSYFIMRIWDSNSYRPQYIYFRIK